MGLIQGYYETYNILKLYQKEEYFPIIFSGHLQYWSNNFIVSNTNYSEKKELLEKIGFLFEEIKKI